MVFLTRLSERLKKRISRSARRCIVNANSELMVKIFILKSQKTRLNELEFLLGSKSPGAEFETLGDGIKLRAVGTPFPIFTFHICSL